MSDMEQLQQSDDDSDLDSYRQRNQKILELQRQQLQFKEQMLKYITNKDYDEYYQSPAPQPIETNYSTNHSAAFQSMQFTTPKSNNQKHHTQTKPTNRTPICSSRVQVKKSITPNKLSQSFLSPHSNTHRSQFTSNKPKKAVGQVQTVETFSCRITKKQRLIIQLQSDMDKSTTKQTQTSPILYQRVKQKQKSSNQKCKTQASDDKKSTYYVPIHLRVQEDIAKREQKLQQLKYQHQQLIQGPQPRKKAYADDTLYITQSIWAKERQDKLVEKRIQQGERDCSFDECTHRPKLNQQSIQIVKDKYHNATLADRQQAYKERLNQKRIDSFLKESEQSPSIRMSPQSRKILRSITPKYNRFADYSSSFSATNASYINNVTHHTQC